MSQQITDPTSSDVVNANKSISNADESSMKIQHSARVERLKQICRNTTFTEEDKEDDDRLKYRLKYILEK